MITSSGPRDRRPTLWGTVQKRAIAQRHRFPMGLIHRLDRDASGLLVFSKHDEAYQALKKQFFRHTVERVYLAVVHGVMNQGKGQVSSRLVERADGSVHSTNRPGVGELAISHFEVCETANGYSLVRVTLETGRKHQIRVHLSEMGFPVVGDEVYKPKQGPTRKQKTAQAKLEMPANPQLMLTAVRLCLDHPMTEKRMEFEIDLPPHMREFMRALK